VEVVRVRIQRPAFIFSIRDVDTTDQDNEQDNFGALLAR